MIQAGPVIHCCGPKLQLDFDPLCFTLKGDCRLQDEMQALIAGFFWFPDIILGLDDPDVFLTLDESGHFIDIVHIGADRPHADQVVDLLQGNVKIRFKSLFFQLFAHAVVAFQTSCFLLDHAPP